MEDVGSRFARRLREIRDEKRMTQEQLAVAAGSMSRAFLGALERGEKAPGLETMARLAKALGVDVVDLVGPRPASANPGEERPEQRLGRSIEAMATGSPPATIRHFERIAKAYFAKARG